MTSEIRKDEVRATVKEALDLYRQNAISEEALKTIAASALALEITVSLQTKVERREHKVREKGRRLRGLAKHGR